MTKGLKMLAADDGFTYAKSRSCTWLIDIENDGVKVVSVAGQKPYARPFIAAIIECPEVKEAIKTFQAECNDNATYFMQCDEKMSGATDLILKTAMNVKGFDVIYSKKIMHVSMYDKATSNFYKFSFRELIELAKYFDLLEHQTRVEGLEANEVSYFNPQTRNSSFCKGASILD